MKMPKNKLFDEESEDEVSFTTHSEYAKKYDKWREKEELHKLEQKYGSKATTSDASSDSEDESDEPPEVSEEMETQFLKTLALLKTKDPRIYDPNFKFFDEKTENKEEAKPKAKSLTFEDSDESDDDGNIFTIEKKAEIVKEKKEDKSNKDSEEGKLKDYLTGKAEHVDTQVEADLAPLKALWSDPKLNEGEAFLRDYILNKKYLEEDDTVPADKVLDDEELEEDEKRVEEQGKFERAYNFRFEEPDEEYLKRFPRTMNYIRPKDDRRSRKRAEIRERKEEEKKRKMEEIARMKALKLKEIQEKISRIKEVTGNKDLAFEEQDIEGDFDPEEHDRRMKAIFDEEYYHEADDQKPVFPDLDEELEIENWENYEEGNVADQSQDLGEEEPHCEDDDFNMDADYDPKTSRATLQEEIEKTLGKKRRNRKKKSKLANILSESKPKFVPTVEKTYDEYMEEYYKMDCEDVIGGDLPTRFKYRQVVPNDYGLSIEEILLADDKELTQWVPLKKIVRHRPVEVEKSEVSNYKQKASDVNVKRRILPSLFKDLPEEPEIVVPPEETIKKKKKKKKNKRKDTTDNTEQNENNDNKEQAIDNENLDVNSSLSIVENEGDKAKRKNKKRKEKRLVENKDESVEINEDNVEVAQENGTSSEVNKKRKKNKNKINNSVDSVAENVDTNVSKDIGENNTQNNEGNTKKSKKKQKLDGFIVENVNMAPSLVGSVVTPKSVNKNLKRKADDTTPVPQKKKKNKGNKKDFNPKFNKGNKQGQDIEKRPSNPLTNLSDERLKAYGLNPKKYRSFLKYKKF